MWVFSCAVNETEVWSNKDNFVKLVLPIVLVPHKINLENKIILTQCPLPVSADSGCLPATLLVSLEEEAVGGAEAGGGVRPGQLELLQLNPAGVTK